MGILDLIEADGSTLRKVAGTYGGELAGACPWCGGNDRFRVWPEHDGGRYWCRGCEKSGDSIQYLRERRGLSFVEACRYLGRDPGPRSNGTRPAPAAWEPREATAPPAAWQDRARSFLDGAVSCLWSEHGAGMRAWLRGKGLGDDIIKKSSLGLNLMPIIQPRASWGLEPSLKDDGTERRQWIPAGLVIPHIVNGAVHRLRIRRDDPGDGARYVIVSGSSSAPMTLIGDQGVVVIVESDLDGLLLNQEAGDLAGVVAMGSAQAKPDRIIHAALMAAAVILVSLDGDRAGAKASWTFWPDTYGSKVKRWPCIKGKDPSEARQNGLDIRSWIIAGIFEKEARFERFCIQTIDGGLTDVQALEAMTK